MMVDYGRMGKSGIMGKVSSRVSLCKTSPHVHFSILNFFMIFFSDMIQPMIVEACFVLIFGKYLRFGSGLICSTLRVKQKE